MSPFFGLTQLLSFFLTRWRAGASGPGGAGARAGVPPEAPAAPARHPLRSLVRARARKLCIFRLPWLAFRPPPPCLPRLGTESSASPAPWITFPRAKPRSKDDRYIFASVADLTQNQQREQQRDARTCPDSVVVWDACTGAQLHRLRSHTSAVYVIFPSPADRNALVSAGYDGKVVMWDVRTGALVTEWDIRGNQPVDSVKLVDARSSPDGLTVVAADEAGNVYYIGTGAGEAMRGAKEDQFLSNDYNELMRDDRGWVLDAVLQQQPHLVAREAKLCDAALEAYPEPYQAAYQESRRFAAAHAAGPLPLQPPLAVRAAADAEARRAADSDSFFLTETPL